MTDVEKRREKLLHETRKNYPAVHPRYQAAYLSLYGEEKAENENNQNTFWVRLVIAAFLLALFFIMDYRKEEIGFVDSQYIVNEVQRDLLSQ